MNAITETKNRLRLLLVGFQTIADNYGVTNAQATAFAVQMQELQDIIDNVDIAPPAPPVTVDFVVASILEKFEGVEGKVDALIALANNAGEPAVA